MRRLTLALAVLLLAGCSDPEKERLRETTIPTYDKTTGKLVELTFDSNKDGRIDTWTTMDGARPVLTRMDRDGDGQIDRWEHYGPDGKLVKVGFSRKNDGQADAWAFEGPDGLIERIEISSIADEKRIDRWEFYDAAGLVRAEDDTSGDGLVDKWETYENGAVKTAAFDENADGKPDRRFTYEDGRLVLIETDPDVTGRYTKRIVPQM
ncbi:hypothetical protein BH23PLA1_BH23PLA1_44150 [soil metagenome]